jgi:hypothetical protein
LFSKQRRRIIETLGPGSSMNARSPELDLNRWVRNRFERRSRQKDPAGR